MPSRKPTVRGKQRPVKRLLDEIAPKQQQQRQKQQQATNKPVVVVDLTCDNSSNQASTAGSEAKLSSADPKQKKQGKGKGKEGKKKELQKGNAGVSANKVNVPSSSAQQVQGQQLLLDIPRTASPTSTAYSQFFYSPMYRRYFGVTPPNPRLYNPRLLEDYVDWYLNVYLEEELPWHSMNIGTVAERVRQSEEEAREEARQFAAASSSSPVQDE